MSGNAHCLPDVQTDAGVIGQNVPPPHLNCPPGLVVLGPHVPLGPLVLGRRVLLGTTLQSSYALICGCSALPKLFYKPTPSQQ